MYSIGPNRENFAFDGKWSTSLRSKLSCWVGTLVLLWVCMFDVVLRDEFHGTWSLVLLSWFGEEWNTSISKSQRSRAGIPTMRKPASREVISASVGLCDTDVLFLAHPTYWHERVTSEYALESTWCWFWVFQVSGKIRVLKQSYSALSCCISPHDTVVWIHMCDECLRSNVLSVCHRLWSISWQHEQVCSRTTEYQVYQYGPNTGISEQSVSRPLTILQPFPFLLPWAGGRQCMVLRLCIVVELFCSPVHNIVPRTSLHDIPYHRTMRKCLRQVFQNKIAFCSSSRDFGFKHIPVIVCNIFACLTFSLSATQINIVKEWCWFSQINVFHENFPSRLYVFCLAHQFGIVHMHR